MKRWTFLVLEWALRALAGICMAIGWLMLTAQLGIGKAYAFLGIVISIFFLDSRRKNPGTQKRGP